MVPSRSWPVYRDVDTLILRNIHYDISIRIEIRFNSPSMGILKTKGG